MPKRKPADESTGDEDRNENTIDDLVDDDGLQNFVRRFPTVRRVSIQRYKEETQRFVHKGSEPAELVNEDFIQKKYRGGLYRLSFHNGDGAIVTTKSNIEIDDPIETAPATPAVAPAAAVPDLYTMMQAQMNRDHTMMLALIARPQPAMDFAGIMPLVQLLSKQGQPNTTEMMDIFFKGMEASRGGDDAGGLGVLGSIIAPLLTPAIVERLEQRRLDKGKQQLQAKGKAQPAAAAAEEEGDIDMEEVMQYLVDTLKPMALADADPGLMVRLAVKYAEADPDQHAMMTDMLAKPFVELLRDLGKVDPEMTRQPIAGWLQEFYLKLSNALQGDRSAAGTPGDKKNAAGDAAAGA